jgi:hypothetical protein
VLCTVVWAWTVDIAMLNNPVEHSLPDWVFTILTMPASILAELVLALLLSVQNYLPWFTGLLVLTAGAAAQVALLWSLSKNTRSNT